MQHPYIAAEYMHIQSVVQIFCWQLTEWYVQTKKKLQHFLNLTCKVDVQINLLEVAPKSSDCLLATVSKASSRVD